MPITLEPDADGKLPVLSLATGQVHKIALRVLELDHRYHDDDPVQGAAFEVRFANGLHVTGTLDAEGKARLLGVPGGRAEVRYGPDTRPYEPIEQPKNPDYRASMSDADLDALVAKHG